MKRLVTKADIIRPSTDPQFMKDPNDDSKFLTQTGLSGHEKLLQFGPTGEDMIKIKRALTRIENRFGTFKDPVESDWDQTMNEKCSKVQLVLNPSYEPNVNGWIPGTGCNPEYGPGAQCAIELYQKYAKGIIIYFCF